MKTYSRLLLAFLLLILVVPQVGADEPLESGEEVIVWSDSSGKFKIEAAFVELVDDKLVVLKRASDGKVIKIPLDKLDEESKSQAKSLHVEAQQSSLDPAVVKQLEEMGLVRQKDTWRLEDEVNLNELISRYKKLTIDYKKLQEKRVKANRYRNRQNKKTTKNKPTGSKYSFNQAKQMALIQAQKQLGTNKTPSLAALDHVATYSKGRASRGRRVGNTFKSSATNQNQRKLDEQFVRNFRSLFLYDEVTKIKMQNAPQMREKIIKSVTMQIQERQKTKQMPNSVAVRNWIRDGYSGTSEGNGAFEREILKECQIKYRQWLKGESLNSTSTKSKKKTGGINVFTVEILDGELFSMAPEINNLRGEVTLKFDQLLQSLKAFSNDQDEAERLLAATSQNLKILSDHQVRIKRKRFEKMSLGVRDQDGEKDGIWTKLYENGQKKMEEHYKDGELDGLGTGWYENGKKFTETHYKNGKQEGLSTFWHENGQKKLEGHYKDGKKDGRWTEWHENGQKEREAPYKDGKEDGTVTWWYENGQKQAEGHFKDGLPDSPYTIWDENGQKKE